MGDFKRLDRQVMYKGRIITVAKDRIELPDGREADWDIVMHNGAAAIIPIDSDGKIILVRQYRNAVGDYTLEIPAGGLEKGEDPQVCASRELEEETGNSSENIEFLFKMYSAVGFSDEVLYIYIARDLQLSKQNLDEDEFVEVERYTLDELVEMIFDGKIVDSKTIASILAYKTKYVG